MRVRIEPLRPLFVFWLLLMLLAARHARAACPEASVIAVSVPVVYQDCMEFFSANPGNPGNHNLSTSSGTHAGDYQVLVVVRGSNTSSATITTPAGWSVLMPATRNSAADGQNDLVMGVYAKVATAAGAENVLVTTDTGGSSNDLLMWIMRFSNTVGAGVSAGSAPAANTIVTAPGVTTTSANNLILRVAGIDDDDINATDTNVFGAPRIAITLQETDNTGNAITGVAAYDVQSAAGASGSAAFNNGGTEEWIAHTVALVPQAYFTLTHAASASSCDMTTISIAARNTDGSLIGNYTGTIQLSTSSAHGNWSVAGGDANGTLLTSNNDSGVAAYTFSAADNGTVALVFQNTHQESVNFDVVDSVTGYRELKTLGNDSDMTFTACAGVHHYHISNSGTGISCLAENITFTAHDAAHSVVAPGAGVVLNISTSTNKGSWSNPPGLALVSSPASNNGVAAYTFQHAQTSVTIPFNYTSPTTDPELVGFNVIDSAMATELEEGNLSIASAGLRFFNDTAGASAWPGQVAGMDSLLFTGQELVVMAVRASDNNPAACEPLFTDGAVLPVQLLFECNNATSCAAAAVQVAVTNNAITTPVNTINSNGDVWMAPVAEAEFVTLNLLFEAFHNGDFGSGNYSGARLRLNYGDAGQLQLHGRYQIPFNNSAEGSFGMSDGYLRGSSSVFTVRPFGLDVDFTDDRRSNSNASLALDHNGPAFGKAGVPIDVSVKAVAWQASDDLDADGYPDFEARLSDNSVTPNFGNETGFNYRVGLSVITDNPNVVGVNDNPGVPGGVVGTLDQVGTLFSFVGGVSTGGNTIAFNEVGIFDVQAVLLDYNELPTAYLDFQPVFGGVPNVGRITPAHYDLDLAGSFINERPDAGGSAAFTYMGEEFDVALAPRAEHANGTVLRNYFGDFAKLNDLDSLTTQFVFKAFVDVDAPPAATDDIDYSTRLAPVPGSFSFIDAWAAGEARVAGRLVFSRVPVSVHPQTQEEAPITNMTIAVDLDDGDGIHDEADVGDDDGTGETDNYTWHYIDKNEWRYGRLRLENAYGSELREEDELSGRDVPMRLVTEYWDGAGFIVNTEDNGTAFDIQHLHAVAPPRYPALNSHEGNLAAGEFSNTAGISTVLGGLTLERGATDQPFYFTAPGEGNDGAVVMEFDLEAAGLDFLRYKWRSDDQIDDVFTIDDSEYDDDPRALLEFGRYQGNERIINWQELFCQEPAPCPR
jgi:hypothetical protein